MLIMTREEMAKTVNALYAATAAGNFELAETMLSDDLTITEADSLPYAGVYRGRGALRELFNKVMGMMDVAGLDRVQTIAGGDYAAELLSFRFIDPALAPASLCEVYRFRDGKVCEIIPYYFDPAPIIAACKAKRGRKS
jgi:ketosteroid isomerase-like protein